MAILCVAPSSQRLAAADHQSLWSASAFHRTEDGNGKTIPCRCALHGQLVPLGTLACLQTHLGTQIARCDLALNITSWVPTGVHCETSRLHVDASHDGS